MDQNEDMEQDLDRDEVLDPDSRRFLNLYYRSGSRLDPHQSCFPLRSRL